MQKTTILSVKPVTHDVKQFRLRRPDGFDYQPGDATELALDRDGWQDEKRPFTMTSLPSETEIEFTIKGYPDHDGVTMRLHELEEGASVMIDEPFETFRYHGPAVFIAGGAGLTPFLAMLRDRQKNGGSDGDHLIYANKTRADVIHESELNSMDGLTVHHVLSKEEADGYRHGHVDAALLKELVQDLDKRFYVCGPPPMQEAVEKTLDEIGVEADSVSFSD